MSRRPLLSAGAPPGAHHSSLCLSHSTALAEGSGVQARAPRPVAPHCAVRYVVISVDQNGPDATTPLGTLTGATAPVFQGAGRQCFSAERKCGVPNRAGLVLPKHEVNSPSRPTDMDADTECRGNVRGSSRLFCHRTKVSSWESLALAPNTNWCPLTIRRETPGPPFPTCPGQRFPELTWSPSKSP